LILAFREREEAESGRDHFLSLYFQNSNSQGKLCQGFELYILFGLLELIKKQDLRGLDKKFPQMAASSVNEG
jgi:hypothetical protein